VDVHVGLVSEPSERVLSGTAVGESSYHADDILKLQFAVYFLLAQTQISGYLEASE
jgi:hypothetical protein